MKTFRTKVFSTAHEIRKETGKSFAVSLSIAWKVYRLKKRMKAGAVTFTYEKKDGSLRKATGTLNISASTGKSTGRSNYKSIAYFDIAANSFRSFKPQNLISIY